MDRNIRLARELVRIAKELVAFKGAQKIMDAIVGMTGWDASDEGDFKKIDEWKNKVMHQIRSVSTVDGNVRDMYMDWLRDRACNGEIGMFVVKNTMMENERKASFYDSMQEPLFINTKELDEIHPDIEFLFHGNQKCQGTLDEVNKRIKSKSISIAEMERTVTPLRKRIKETTNNSRRESLMRKFESEGKKVYSNGSWSVILFDDISQRQDLVDFAGHCTRWCITAKGSIGDERFQHYSDKYYVICDGNTPVDCFYESDGILHFEQANSERFTSIGNGKIGEDPNTKAIQELYDNGNTTMKELLRDIIPDICGRLGFRLDWKVV